LTGAQAHSLWFAPLMVHTAPVVVYDRSVQFWVPLRPLVDAARAKVQVPPAPGALGKAMTPPQLWSVAAVASQ
jgi:hypothetical protein